MAPMHPSSYQNLRSDFDEDSPENTVPQFWQMIWETKAKIVVMLCNVSPGFTGCSQYFPDEKNQEMSHGKFKIENLETLKNSEAGIIERKLKIAKNGEEFSICHLQFSLWPNYGVPENVGKIGDFVKKVVEKTRENGTIFSQFYEFLEKCQKF